MTKLYVEGIFDGANAGFVPAGFTGGGGGSISDGVYGEVTVSLAGTVWTISNLPQSRITGLVASLAALVPQARVVAGTAPIRVDGGASADLDADITVSVSTFASGSSGVVPASGGGTTNFLRADGSWAAPVSAPSAFYDVSFTADQVSFGPPFNDWTPAVGGVAQTLGTRTLILYTTDASSRIVHGLTGGVDGKMVTFVNMNPNPLHTILFEHESGSASASNQFFNAGGGQVSGSSGGSVTYYYIGSQSRWRHVWGTQ